MAIPRSLRLTRRAYRTVAFDGVPMFRAQAWALYDARANGVKFTVNSADRRRGVAERYGKQSQHALYQGWINRRPGYFPANPPGYSSHELKSDGHGFYGRRGAAIPSYKLGIDAVNRPGGDSSELVNWLNRNGYKATRPYGTESERHHFSFAKSPATNARRRLAAQRLREAPKPSPRGRLAERAKWRAREIYRLRRWQRWKKTGRMDLRKKWYNLYIEARDRRRSLDRVPRGNRGARKVSNAGVGLVASFEGFRSRPYKDPVGVWTIGYGETEGIGPHTQPWTKAFAQKRLRARLDRDYVPAVLGANSNLTQNQLDGFASFVYNVGVGGVARSTRVGRALRAGKVREAADEMLAWDKAGGRRLEGLTRRRQAERALILK